MSLVQVLSREPQLLSVLDSNSHVILGRQHLIVCPHLPALTIPLSPLPWWPPGPGGADHLLNSHFILINLISY